MGGRGDAVNLANKQLIDVSDLQYGLEKDDHVKPLYCCMIHYKNIRPSMDKHDYKRTQGVIRVHAHIVENIDLHQLDQLWLLLVTMTHALLAPTRPTKDRSSRQETSSRALISVEHSMILSGTSLCGSLVMLTPTFACMPRTLNARVLILKLLSYYRCQNFK